MKPGSGAHAPIRKEWLALRQEAVVQPEAPIVDAHHHLWRTTSARFDHAELLQEVACGHHIVGTVFVEGRQHYRTDGPVALRPIGETEFVVQESQAASKHADLPRVAAGIVGYADLTAGDAVRAVLQEHIGVGAGRFRGIRQAAVWHEDPTLNPSAVMAPRGLLLDPRFREGFAHLADLGLSFDAWLLYTQLPELSSLAGAFPRTRIVINHLGGPLGIGRGGREGAQVMQAWKSHLRELAALPNLFMKIGGVGMPLFGFEFDQADRPPSSDELMAAIRPCFETCIDLFGPHRCMFESNFPVDQGSFSYTVIWNAFKKLAAEVCPAKSEALLGGTATDFYRLQAR